MYTQAAACDNFKCRNTDAHFTGPAELYIEPHVAPLAIGSPPIVDMQGLIRFAEMRLRERRDNFHLSLAELHPITAHHGIAGARAFAITT